MVYTNGCPVLNDIEWRDNCQFPVIRKVNIVICHSCDQLVYVDRKCIYGEYYRSTIEKHWRTNCTGNVYCDISYKDYMELKSRFEATIGNIVKTLHYGHFASNWWTLIKNKNIWIPWCINCRICVFKRKTENNIIEQLLFEILFQPFQIKHDNITIFITNIGVSDDKTLYFAGSGYISSFNHKVRENQCLVVQTINEYNVSIHVYRHGIRRKEYFGISPKEVWKKMTICQEKNPMALFGLTNLVIQSAIKQQMETPLCNFKQWMDLDIMTPIFQKYLKRQIEMSDLPWHNFFIKWFNQKSKIIELTTALADIYPTDYKLGDPAKNFTRINGPGCSPITKLIVTRSRVSKVQDQQFETFFSDKNNVSMIMARLAGGRYVYKQDLGGLCSICNDYGYEVFNSLIKLIETNIIQKERKQTLIHEIEIFCYYMRREYEKELLINLDGTTDHVSCINHCLLYAFGKCTLLHSKRCENCDQLFDFFNTIKDILPSEHYAVLEKKLDDKDALILADYKMKILSKSACEKKEQFFGKRGWTLHTILFFTKKDVIIEVQTFDHWSLDTRQDAWFTASSFDAVFETLEIKPEWIKIFSDNGGHYH
ncbi:hypothetical protein Glove_107g3 [Diversispora epigaea]|uniref:Uncharacterized protein n=1 Tax=Diversispora epigaea TaxID=1348612 RepID=A0A397JD84_9GLOM|nr:hypothetical protein Glove_107g3 [Diversispora epigaea]